MSIAADNPESGEASLGELVARLGRDTVVVTICTLLSRITGFGRVLATAAVLGNGALGDVYQSANLIPNLIFELVAGGVLQAVLVPAFVAARRERGDEGLTTAVRSTNGAVLSVLAAVAVVGMAASPLIARLLVLSEPSSVIASEKLDVMVPMVLVFVPQLVFYGLSMVTSAALHARGRFVAAALAPGVNNVIVIIACVLFRESRQGALATLHITVWQFVLVAGGTTLGVIAFSLAPAAVLRRQGVRWWPRWRPDEPAVRLLRTSFGWATLSIVGTLVPTGAALVLGNGAEGGVAVFVYAFAFYVLPHALVAVPLATTLAPKVADRWQVGDRAAAAAAIDTGVAAALPLLALAGAGLVGLAWPLARVAAFGQTASLGLAPIAHTFTAFGPGLVGYGIAFVMTRVLFALGDVRRASVLMIGAAVSGVATMVVTSVTMAPSERAAALAIGYGASQTVAAVLLVHRVHVVTGAARVGTVLRSFADSTLAAALATVVMLGVVSGFSRTRSDSLGALFVAGVSGVLVFGTALALFRWPELRRRWARQDP